MLQNGSCLEGSLVGVGLGVPPFLRLFMGSLFHFESKKNIRGEMVFFSWGGATFDDSFMPYSKTQLSWGGFYL